MKQIQFSIEINSTKENVWRTLWQDETFRQWAHLIDPETYMVGELKEGSQIQFISAANGYGVTSLVEKVIENEYLQLRHSADTQDTGQRERDNQWTGSQETYVLTQNDGTTTLTVTFGVPSELEEYFRENYPKALEKIKQLAESKVQQ